jgi:hypothetical protein
MAADKRLPRRGVLAVIFRQDGPRNKGRLRLVADRLWGVLDTRGTVGAALSMIVYLVVSVLAPLGAA